MRRLLIILGLLAFNFCIGQDYKIESKHFDCFEKSYNKLGVDLKLEMLKFEEHLISKGVLRDKSGFSYHQIFKSIELTGDINFLFEYSLIDSIKSQVNDIEFSEAFPNCVNLALRLERSKSYKKSKIYLLEQAMDSLKSSNNNNVSEIAGIITRILTPLDFEHDYYRLTTMIVLATTKDEESDIVERLPSMPEYSNSFPLKKRNLIKIQVSTDNDSVQFNDNKVAINDLSMITKRYIVGNLNDTTLPELQYKHIDLLGYCYQSQLIISIQHDWETSYKTYIEVQNQLTEAYRLARNDKAMEYFEIDYDKLTQKQQNAIKELIPIRISEAGPNDN